MRIEKQFVKVINQDGSLAVADYFENAEIETLQTLESGDLDSISTTGLLPLPDEGEEVLQQLYTYNNKVVYCRQKHDRTIYFSVNVENSGTVNLTFSNIAGTRTFLTGDDYATGDYSFSFTTSTLDGGGLKIQASGSGTTDPCTLDDVRLIKN